MCFIRLFGVEFYNVREPSSMRYLCNICQFKYSLRLQYVPVVPGAHVHVYPLTPSTHVDPKAHSAVGQSSISGNFKKEKENN